MKGGTSSIPGWETKILKVTGHSQKKHLTVVCNEKYILLMYFFLNSCLCDALSELQDKAGL